MIEVVKQLAKSDGINRIVMLADIEFFGFHFKSGFIRWFFMTSTEWNKEYTMTKADKNQLIIIDLNHMYNADDSDEHQRGEKIKKRGTA